MYYHPRKPSAHGPMAGFSRSSCRVFKHVDMYRGPVAVNLEWQSLIAPGEWL